jgi:hypothetical protein
MNEYESKDMKSMLSHLERAWRLSADDDVTEAINDVIDMVREKLNKESQ